MFQAVQIIPQNSLSIFEGRDKERRVKEFTIPSIPKREFRVAIVVLAHGIWMQ